MKIKLLLLFLVVYGMSWGQLSITANNTPFTQDFNGLANAGTANTQSGGIFSAGWSFLEGDSNANTTYDAGTGSATAGNTYSFGVVGTNPVTDRAFGMLQSGSLTSILGFKFTNNTSSTITTITIGYTGETWRLASASDGLTFSHQSGNVALNAGSGWTIVPGLTFTTPTIGTVAASDGNAATRRTVISAVTITGLSIAVGGTYTLRWVDTTQSSSAGMAIDDFSITTNIVSTIPTISTGGTLASVNTTYGTPSATPTSFTVSGANMSAGILVTPPSTNYEVSLTSGSGYANTITVGAAGTIASTEVFIRLKATATFTGSPHIGNIVLSSSGAPDVNVATVASSVTRKNLTITGITANDKVFDNTTVATLSGTAAYDGLENGETFSVTGTPSATFASAAVANNVAVTVAGYTAPSTNYTVTQPTGLTANITAPAGPLITVSPNTATAFTTIYGTVSTIQTFAVTGSNLSANVTINAPSGFEVSSDGGTTYGSTATFTQTGGNVNANLRIRLAAAAAVLGSYNAQNITLSSTGATTVNITTTATGNTVTAKSLTITGLTANNKFFDNNTSVTLSGTPAYNGLVNGESFTVVGTGIATFATAAVGNNKTVSVTGYLTPTTNYTLTQPSLTATIFAINFSDVVPVVNSEAPTISSLINNNAPLTSTTGAAVWQFTIRDGGATSDGDDYPTKISAITISRITSSIDYLANINTAALFDNTGTLVATASLYTSSSIAFTGLSLLVADNGSSTYTLRLSLKTVLSEPLTIDGKDFGFSISNTNITAVNDGTSSLFSSFASASSENDKNIIAVVATRLAFVQNASNTSIGSGMAPALTISAKDANGNRDLNYVTQISLTSTGTLVGSPISVNPVAGLATFAGLTHSVVGTNLTLSTNNSTGLTNVTSAVFDIVAGPSILSPGDIAIIASQSATATDQFAFVILRDINSGTVINFTDNGMLTTTAGRLGEGFLIFTAPTALCAGTVIYWRTGATSAPAISDGWNTNSGTPSGFQLNSGGDNIFAFQGATANWASQSAITILFGVLTGVTWSPLTADTTKTSCIPASLSSIYTLNFPATNNADIYLNVAAASFIGTAAQIITNVTNASNYTAQDGVFTMPAYNSFLVAAGTSTLSTIAICSGSNATVTITDGLLTSGNYIVTYSLAGANTLSTATTTMAFAAGVGTFIVPNLVNAGNTTLTINRINNGCDRGLSPNTLDLLVGATSTFNGTWDVLPSIGRNLVFNANYNTAGDLLGCSCTVNAGVAVTIPNGSTLTLENGITVNAAVGTSLTFDNNASLVQINPAAINTGNIRYLRNTRPTTINFTFTYWGAPVAGQTLGSIWMSPDSADTFYTWNNITNCWTALPASTQMTPGIGYIARARIGGQGSDFSGTYTYTANTPWTARFNGVPNNGNYSVAVTSSSGGNTGTLLANPYPSAIDLITFRDDPDNLELSGNFYFWTSNTPINSNNQYVAADYAIFNVALNAGVGTTSGATPAPDRYVDAGQGFFADGLSAGSIIFKNTHRVAGNNNLFYRNNITTNSVFESHKIWLNITNSQGLFKQQLLTYTTGATNGYDPTLDAKTYDGNVFADFYSHVAGAKYAIQSRALPFVTTDLVPLGFKTTVAGAYTIAIDHFDGLFANQTVYLQDNLLNIDHNLTSSPYNFNTTTGTFNNRFVLKYTSTMLNTNNPNLSDNILIVSNTDNLLKIKSSTENISKVVVYDLLGRTIFEKDKIDATTFETRNISLNQQALIVKVVLQNGFVETKKIVF